MRASHTIEHGEASTMLGYYSALRENWESNRPWIYDPIPVAQLRYGLITPEEAGLAEEEPVEPVSDDDDTAPETILDAPFKDDDDLEIDFVEIDKTTRISNGLRSGIISVNIRSHSWKVSINRADTKSIKDKHVKYVMMGKTKSGDVVIQFNNNSKGVAVVYTNDSYCNVNSRHFVENFRQLLGITADLAYLRIEKIAEKMDSITYKVILQ